MSSFKRKTLRVVLQFLLVPGLSERGECPGMSPSRGKYLACRSCERAALKERKEMRDPLICLSTQLWKWKKCSYLTHTTLRLLWCVCVFVQIAHQHVCVKSGQRSGGSRLTAVYFEHDYFHSLTSVKNTPLLF